MTEKEFYKFLYRRLAQISIGASAIRNQGSGGLIEISRTYFQKKINLKIFVKSLKDETQYKIFLDNHTNEILSIFPAKAKSWGAARKGINLFLRETIYNKFFSHQFSLPESFDEFNDLVKFMEVPLDKEVANGLISDSNEQLPKWINIKNLTPSLSETYQIKAFEIAINEKIARVNLDLKYWRSE